MKALYTSIPLALCLIICACRTDGRETPTIATPVAQHGVLQTVGNRIVDQHGAPPQLRGISFSWSIWEGRKYYNDAVVDWLVDDFHVSLIRLSMAIEPDEGYLQQPEKQMALIRQIADRGIKRGIYVIIDWHDHNADRNIEQAKAFFGEMAKRYTGIPNIIYEIWNEPERQSWQTIKEYSITIIDEIRKYDTENIIVVGSPHWDQDVDVTANDPITGYDNIAYSFHFYASDPHHQDNLRKKAETALANGLPIIVTEWGVGESNGDGVFDEEKTGRWMEWMEDHQLSWANWNITDKDETTAILAPGAPISGNWTPAQLTPAGRYIREQLRKFHIR
ncbi:MAG TPA: glycoside hydrolase family 5 protein [Parapedobacter sp.]|uniref:glycoside hydrolase family 5 protein n=1 Tax=Parapedobacter sp. TaxID=1958893 RepID=UPI002CA42A64|nr:glycoside hydrolase family 5 protein [Parapedobacter sp.]HWK56729.1 glycoside hydrolase family 5 protein [Parapedobacter sp.]